MSEDAYITILIAEDNDVNREMMTGVLRMQGYKTLGAIDGESAIKVIQEHSIDLALVDINMAPSGGFEFVKYVLSKGLKIPVVVVTSDDSSDILVKANSLGVVKVLQKPIKPDRLAQTVQRILKRQGLNPAPLAVGAYGTGLSPEELMKRAIELADENARSGSGGPFGAVVANSEGKILGEGTNGMSSRVDPTAHAEVMAIRQAAERLGQADLADCILYSSSEPTMMGQALIVSVGIRTVYYALNHDDTGFVHAKGAPEYKRLGHDEALAMYKKWEKPINP